MCHMAAPGHLRLGGERLPMKGRPEWLTDQPEKGGQRGWERELSGEGWGLQKARDRDRVKG